MRSIRARATTVRHPWRWRRAVVIIGGMAIGLVVGLLLAAAQTPRFESNLRLLVGPIAGPRATLDASGLLALTYAEALASNELVARTAESIGEPLDVDDVAAIANQQSRIVLLVVSSDDGTVPQIAADTMATLMIDLTDQRVVPTDGSLDAGQLTVLDRASPPKQQRDHRLLIVLFAMAAGGIAGWGLIRRWSMRHASGRPADTAFVNRLAVPVVVVDPASDVHDGSLSTHTARQLEVALAAAGGDALVSFALLHDDRQLIDLVAEIAHAFDGDRMIELGDPDALLADEMSPEQGGATAPDGVIVHFGKRNGAADNVFERFGNLVEARTAGASLWVVGIGLGSSALCALSSMVADSVVLVLREQSLSQHDVAEALEFLQSIDVRPACILMLAGRGAVAPSRVASIDDVTARLSRRNV